MSEPSATEQIDDIIAMYDDWRGAMIAQLRAVITAVDPRITEAVKWKKPSKPEGVPVWELHGAVCLCDTLKNAVRITFPKGAQIQDTHHFFNVRLDSKTVRAIDIYEDTPLDESALAACVLAAIHLNEQT